MSASLSPSQLRPRPPLSARHPSTGRGGPEVLAARFADLSLPAGSPIGLRLPGGPDWLAAFMTSLRAGLTPCLLPMAMGLGPLARAVEDLKLEAFVTCTRVGELSPAAELAAVAGGYFGLRFAMAFGPDCPDGIERLADVDAASRLGAAASQLDGRYILSSRTGDRFTLSDASALSGAAAGFVELTGIREGDRILHLALPDRIAALATSLGAAALARASIEWVTPLSSDRLATLVGDDVPTHLVAPAVFERALARCDLPGCVRSVTIMHRPPVELKSGAAFSCPAFDLVGLDGGALLVGARDRQGRPALSLPPSVRVGADGGIEILGGTVDPVAAEFVRPPFSPSSLCWRASEWRLELFAGRVISVARANVKGRPAET